MAKISSSSSLLCRIFILLLFVQVAGCGGGNSGSISNTTTGSGANSSATDGSNGSTGNSASGNSSGASGAIPPSSLTILTDNEHTAPGGSNITLHLTGASASQEVRWTLEPQDAGRLDRASGNTVSYIPPAAGAALADDIAIRITATVGQTSVSTQVTLVGRTAVTDKIAAGANPAVQMPGNPATPNVPGIFGIVAQTDRTAAGGNPVTLSASKPTATAAVSWSLEAGSVGRLSSTTGDTVQYVPPAANTLNNNVAVVVTAAIGNLKRKTTIFVEGTFGLQLFAGNDNGTGLVNASGTAARFAPQYIARDTQGNLYALAGRTIRKITLEGSVATFAGSSADQGLDDGTGTAAVFMTPKGIAIDSSDNLYVVNTYTNPANNRYNYSVRKITSQGVVTTVGNAIFEKGEPRHSDISAIAIDAQGNSYVADTGVYRNITRITPSGNDTIFASGQWISGVETRLLNVPKDMAFDASGNLYVVDAGTLSCSSICQNYYYAAAIRRISQQGVVTTFAGPVGPTLVGGASHTPPRDGTGTDARFTSDMRGMAIDGTGNLYVTNNGVIRRITPNGVVTTLPAPVNAEPYRTWLASDPAGKLYISSGRGGIRELDVNGNLSTLAGGIVPTAGMLDGNGATALFDNPSGISSDAAGNLYIADENNSAIRQVTPSGDVITLYIAPDSEKNHTMLVADETGRYLVIRSNAMRNVVGDANGNVFFDSFDSIRKRTPAGEVTTVAPSNGRSNALATDAQGNLYSIELFSSTIKKITPKGAVTTITPVNPTETPLSAQGLALDGAGNFYILSHSGVLKMTQNGVVALLAAAPLGRTTTVPTNPFGSTPLNTYNRFAPKAITIDEAGNVYAAYSKGFHSVIQRITSQGTATIVHAYNADEISTGNHVFPRGLAMAGPGTLAITSANGVYRLRLQ